MVVLHGTGLTAGLFGSMTLTSGLSTGAWALVHSRSFPKRRKRRHLAVANRLLQRPSFDLCSRAEKWGPKVGNCIAHVLGCGRLPPKLDCDRLQKVPPPKVARNDGAVGRPRLRFGFPFKPGPYSVILNDMIVILI